MSLLAVRYIAAETVDCRGILCVLQGRVEDERSSLPTSDSLMSAVKALQVRQRVRSFYIATWTMAG